MAQMGNLVEVIPPITSIEFINPIPVGDLKDRYIITSVDTLSPPITNRFPTAPTAGGFLTAVDELLNFPLPSPYPGVAKSINSILAPTGDVLEPQVGQIWPR